MYVPRPRVHVNLRAGRPRSASGRASERRGSAPNVRQQRRSPDRLRRGLGRRLRGRRRHDRDRDAFEVGVERAGRAVLRRERHGDREPEQREHEHGHRSEDPGEGLRHENERLVETPRSVCLQRRSRRRGSRRLRAPAGGRPARAARPRWPQRPTSAGPRRSRRREANGRRARRRPPRVRSRTPGRSARRERAPSRQRRAARGTRRTR